MLRWSSKKLLALVVAATALYALPPITASFAGAGTSAAQASDEEKRAFDDAKSLGTVEAWDAFLSHYASGFYADLARAYVKKLAEPDAAAAPPAASPATTAAPTQAFDYPMVAGSWGGVVRSGPSRETSRVASLEEGEQVTLMAPPIPGEPSDYPWFKIAFRDGQIGYMWGGILCSTGPERPDLFRVCPFTPKPFTANAGSGSSPPPAVKPAPRAAETGNRPSWCAGSTNGAETAICANPDLISLDSAMNVAYRRAKSDSPAATAEIEREQRRWLGRRNLCGNDPGCVRKRYSEQIQLLESYFGN